MSLKYATDAELLAEIERRRKAKPQVPVPLPSPDFAPVIQMILENTAELLASGGRSEREDFSHYVYEAAIEAVYGKAYWPWVNSL
jgi:hypothetical protein